jgi:lysophospholipase L1-like esterase
MVVLLKTGFLEVYGMKIEKNNKLVMIGDSITDCDRAKPIGEGLFGALGNSYVNLVAGLLGAVYPEQNIRVVNMGTSGNTVRDLEKRWQTDVLDLKPDWLSILIGINDVWCQFDSPLQTEEHVYIEEYRKTLERLVKNTLPHLKGLVLITPHYLEPNRNDPMRAAMDSYGKAVKDIAEKYNTVFVDTQAAFDRVLKHYYPATLAWDRVHPNTAGHMVIAREFVNAVGFNW